MAEGAYFFGSPGKLCVFNFCCRGRLDAPHRYADREHQLFCNPLIFNIMQNNLVRGPYFFEGTANNDIL